MAGLVLLLAKWHQRAAVKSAVALRECQALGVEVTQMDRPPALSHIAVGVAAPPAAGSPSNVAATTAMVRCLVIDHGRTVWILVPCSEFHADVHDAFLFGVQAARLNWKHGYQELLEQRAASSMLLPGGSGRSAEPRSNALQELQLRDADIEARLVKIEAKHKVQQRWTEESTEYKEAQRERKAYYVSRLQDKLAQLFDYYHHLGSLLVTRRISTTRREDIRLTGFRRTARSQMRKALSKLQMWHASPGSSTSYTAADITEEHLADPDYVLPWVPGAASCRISPKDAAVHAYFRVEEEKELVVKDLRSMCTYNKHYIQECEKRVQELNEQRAALEGMIEEVAGAGAAGDGVAGSSTGGADAAARAVAAYEWHAASGIEAIYPEMRKIYTDQERWDCSHQARVAVRHINGRLKILGSAMHRMVLQLEEAEQLIGKLASGGIVRDYEAAAATAPTVTVSGAEDRAEARGDDSTSDSGVEFGGDGDPLQQMIEGDNMSIESIGDDADDGGLLDMLIDDV